MSDASNLSAEAIKILFEPAFRAELHRLLWIQPFVNAGEFDAGWSCRDHAITLLAFLATNGIPSELVHGRCMFVQGPLEQAPPVGLGQGLHQPSIHTWLDVAGCGLVDLSPNLAIKLPARWRPIAFDGILFDRWLPSGCGQLIKCADPGTYEAETARASHDHGRSTAVYFEERRESIVTKRLIEALKTINSPLSVRVYERHGSDAYLAVVLHLIDFLSGKARGIAGVSHNKAWRLVVERHSDARAALALRSPKIGGSP
jgi:hypothetical protein